MKCGELRLSDREQGWEVLIPSAAFKNSGSSFFGQKPFRLILPDLLDLYKYLEAYIDRHRGVLLGTAKDPGILFVKTVKTTSLDAAYDSTKFYEAWRAVIQRYGIYNPYTGRGAIKGLLPHGPHNLRDILATHILKQTGSYEQASYADPGYAGCGAAALWSVPATRQGSTGSHDLEPALGSRISGKTRCGRSRFIIRTYSEPPVAAENRTEDALDYLESIRSGAVGWLLADPPAVCRVPAAASKGQFHLCLSSSFQRLRVQILRIRYQIDL